MNFSILFFSQILLIVFALPFPDAADQVKLEKCPEFGNDNFATIYKNLRRTFDIRDEEVYYQYYACLLKRFGAINDDNTVNQKVFLELSDSVGLSLFNTTSSNDNSIDNSAANNCFKIKGETAAETIESLENCLINTYVAKFSSDSKN
ncbi:GSCOCT00014157001.2-RA-CDS [Cotesia congregata]|uniref:Venom vpcc5 n=1 Tax=Cotesia congregata TaxID=51543 RepID=A0A8J2H736_COTCN|nr:GSCOCT00014157001.2-RA-CDS [Cotesia congregata]CAG5081134.1 Putative venom vpcc5 [Cotesia congregata]